MMKTSSYRVRHITRYEYDADVSKCYNQAMLLPRNTDQQTVVRSEVRTAPVASVQNSREDIFGNQTVYFEVFEDHKILNITSESIIDIQPIDETQQELPTLSIEDARTHLGDYSLNLSPPAYLSPQPFILSSPFIPIDHELKEYGKASLQGKRPLIEGVNELMARIFHEFTYDPQFTDIATPLSQVLEHKRGVCQDFAHLAIACLRANGLAARYVSGYLETQPPPGEVKLEGADASHAWFSVLVPGYGWYDFDPTNNVVPRDKHITLGWGRDYSDVPPLKGIIFGGGNHRLDVSVDVKNLNVQQQQQQSQQ